MKTSFSAAFIAFASLMLSANAAPQIFGGAGAPGIAGSHGPDGFGHGAPGALQGVPGLASAFDPAHNFANFGGSVPGFPNGHPGSNGASDAPGPFHKKRQVPSAGAPGVPGAAGPNPAVDPAQNSAIAGQIPGVPNLPGFAAGQVAGFPAGHPGSQGFIGAPGPFHKKRHAGADAPPNGAPQGIGGGAPAVPGVNVNAGIPQANPGASPADQAGNLAWQKAWVEALNAQASALGGNLQQPGVSGGIPGGAVGAGVGGAPFQGFGNGAPGFNGGAPGASFAPGH
ncbi:hypothetical protein H4219_004158 [Mycoemilia scoparia]|uniref:Uncharacterized protein n=1 Tax=Mycoemilia scoparia TaxID=417184 RepID=A0A9W8DSA6_9FUNG|nr:hypothetical protein H4219_004158 [Mycoemilia scoparia]